jgi:alpha-tubulin suppressor-like RCC1 family protein
MSRLALPSLSPDGGRYLNAPAVIVTSSDAGASLRYTLNGTEPTESSLLIASGTTLVPTHGLLKVKAFKPGISSETKTAAYLVGEQVSTGENHTLALGGDGTVWACGRNEYGQLGRSTAAETAKVFGLVGMTAIAGGSNHSLALKYDGTVWSWGYNYYGQVGDGTTTQRLTPVPVIGLSGVAAISGGYDYSLALKSDGTVWGWGANYANQLGDGTTSARVSPVQVVGLTGVVAIAAGQYFGLALKSDGTVWAWGDNSYGQLGSNYTPPGASTPLQVGTITNVIAIAAGTSHALALRDDGSVWAWGTNAYGQLGDNTTNSRGVAAPVMLTGQYVAVAAGLANSAALKSDGTLYTWGQNQYGQIGNGTTTSPVKLPVAVAGLSGITAISSGQHTVAVKYSDGLYGFWSWGYNYYGQLAEGSFINQSIPVFAQFVYADTDRDGIADWTEHGLGSNHLLPDTNGDGIPDGLALILGYSLVSNDTDGDGLSNEDEIKLGLDQLAEDTDGDGIIDGLDVYPVDPTRSALPPPGPGDTTAPVIMITAPFDAVLLP